MLFVQSRRTAAGEDDASVLKGKVKGIYLRGDTYWFAKQVNGRRSFISLETGDYVAALQRAREIVESPEHQPAQSFTAEVDRSLKHKYDTNRYSKMSAESKRSCLTMFADSVKNVPPSNVTGYHCKAFYFALKKRIAPSTAESYMFTLRSFFNWCVRENLCRRNPLLDVQLDRIDRKGRTHFADLPLAQRLIENAPNDDLRYVLFCGFHTGMRKPVATRCCARKASVSLRRAFADYMKSEGVPWISPHVMRHSFASICASKGIDVYRIATWLGDACRRRYFRVRQQCPTQPIHPQTTNSNFTSAALQARRRQYHSLH